MAILKCKMCGGDIQAIADQTYGTCDSCGTTSTLPKASDEQIVNLFNRANHFRRQNDFDKAVKAYESILNIDPLSAEAHWGLVLSKYGIEYVEDPISHERVPTCHRIQHESILSDADYLSSLENADDEYTKSIYEKEARRIWEIQRGILAISSEEKPYDVFICYKETTETGSRTQDSALAQDIYYQLINEGFRVFFSRITLEDKLGQQYEPYIFAALNSAKVMIVIGTKPEYFNAVWVKNEWRRYLQIMKKDRNKLLIPCYSQMDAYDLPEELSMFQSQDMSKIGFMQDLIRGIKKIISTKDTETKWVYQETIDLTPLTPGVAQLLDRIDIFLEDGDFESAFKYCNRVLDLEPRNAQAYLRKLLVHLKIRHLDDLINHHKPLTGYGDYQKAVRFADEKFKAIIEDYNQTIIENIKTESSYQKALSLLNDAFKSKWDTDLDSIDMSIRNLGEAITIFENILGYKNSDARLTEAQESLCEFEIIKEKMRMEMEERKKKNEELKRKYEAYRKEQEHFTAIRLKEEEIKKLKRKKIMKKIGIPTGILLIASIILVNFVILPRQKYSEAKRYMGEMRYAEALKIFNELGHFSDSQIQLQIASEVLYNEAIQHKEEGRYSDAIKIFNVLGDFSESISRKREIISRKENTITAGSRNTIGLKPDGTVVAIGSNSHGQADVVDWNEIIAMSSTITHTVGLRSDGTVVAIGINDHGQIDVESWSDIIAISVGGSSGRDAHTVGLKSDGTVVAIGLNREGRTDVDNWRDIIAISASGGHTVGLKSNGTVVAVGRNNHGQTDVDNWRDIIAISAGSNHTVGLKSNGTVVAIGSNHDGQTDVDDWRDIIAVSAGSRHTVGLKSDGSVVAVGWDYHGQTDVDDWRDIIAISAGGGHTVGLKSDGSVVAVGSNNAGQIDVGDWRLLGNEN